MYLLMKKLLLILLADSVICWEPIELDQWHLSDLKGLRNISIQVTSPGGIYTDLENAGLIGNIYDGFNDVDLRWVAEIDWVYKTTISPKSAFDMKFRELEFQGLDTAASILVNNHLIASTDNMFRKYILDLTNIPTQNNGEYEIAVIFTSPVNYARDMFDEQSKDHMVPPDCVPGIFKGFCHANHIRKMQSSFSWDWGPAAPSVGIWKPAYYFGYSVNDKARILDVDWETKLIDRNDQEKTNTFEIVFRIGLKTVPDFSGTLTVQVSFFVEEKTVLSKNVTIPPNSEFFTVTMDPFEISVNDSNIWWPNGYGEQKLHDVNVSVLASNKRLKQSLGFRDIKLVKENLDKGKSFYFVVNGVSMFMKGSNWIPAHVLPEKVTQEYLEDLLYSAKEANMNMLRVWGGGIYESDQFYELADKLGILIWQDFMFACSMYPANEPFLQTVSAEVYDQVRRLKRHPSIALWAANNENEAALRTNWYGTDSNFDVYVDDYKRLYVDTVSKVVKEQDPSRPFLLSSPSNGVVEDESECVSHDPYSVFSGDIHYYNYRDNNWDASIYATPRFASEYGFQSYSAFEILKQYSTIKLNMFVDEEKLESSEGLDYMVYLTQIYQAVSLQVQTEHYRRQKNTMNEKGEGMTMGALYWQLNDIWPGVSWSSLEYGGFWKMSHYYAKNAFAPTLVSPVIENNIVNVHILCDPDLGYPLNLEIRILKWDLSEVYTETIQLVDYCYEFIVYSKSLSDLMELGDCRAGTSDNYRLKYCFIEFNLIRTDTAEVISQNTIHDTPNSLTGSGDDAALLIQKPNVVIHSISLSNMITKDQYVESYDIELKSDSLALFVWLQAIPIEGTFSENGFHMTATSKIIQFNAKKYTDVEQLWQVLTVRAYQPF